MEAVLDTGSPITCIDLQAIRSLGLTYIARIHILTPSSGPGGITCDQMAVSLTIIHPLNPALGLTLGRTTVTDALLLHTGIPALIGCDLLRKWAFLFDGRAGEFTLDY